MMSKLCLGRAAAVQSSDWEVGVKEKARQSDLISGPRREGDGRCVAVAVADADANALAGDEGLTYNSNNSRKERKTNTSNQQHGKWK